MWKVIKDAEKYEINESGEVRIISSGKIKKPSVTDGRSKIQLSVGKDKLVCWMVHRLVAIHFLEPPSTLEYREVAHRDGNALNNHVSNLYWATRIENAADKVRHGTALRGTRHWMSKLTDEQVDYIRKCGDNTVVLGKQFGVSISNIRNFKTYSYTTPSIVKKTSIETISCPSWYLSLAA